MYASREQGAYGTKQRTMPHTQQQGYKQASGYRQAQWHSHTHTHATPAGRQGWGRGWGWEVKGSSLGSLFWVQHGRGQCYRRGWGKARQGKAAQAASPSHCLHPSIHHHHHHPVLSCPCLPSSATKSITHHPSRRAACNGRSHRASPPQACSSSSSPS